MYPSSEMKNPLQMKQSARSTANRERAVVPNVHAGEEPGSSDALENEPTSGQVPSDNGHCIVAWGKDYPATQGSEHALYVYCTRGRGTCSTGDQNLAIGPGTFLIIPAGVPYSFTATPDDPWTVYWLEVQGAVTTKYLQALGFGDTPPVVRLGQDARLVELATELLEVLDTSHDPDNLVDASNILRHLMTVLVRRQRESTSVAPDATQRVAASIEFMQRNLAHPIDVPLLSQMAKLSQSHYSALFKRQTGYSPVDYLLRLRVRAAAELLESTNQGIKTIAARLGYKDPLYFSRVFAGVQGVSPSEYRQGRRQLAGNGSHEG